MSKKSEPAADQPWHVTYYKDFVNDFNILAKIPSEQVKVGGMLHAFCNYYIPQGCNTTDVLWTLDPVGVDLHDRVVVLAHSQETKRALGVISRQNDGKIAPYLCYRIDLKTVKTKTFRSGPNKKTKYTKEVIADSTKQPPWLVTIKRGFQLILKESLDANITRANMHLHEDTLIRWYKTYVLGMEQPPPKELIRSREDFRFEQFMIHKYPTEEWRAINKDYKRQNKKRIRFSDDPMAESPTNEEEQEDEEEKDDEPEIDIKPEELEAMDFSRIKMLINASASQASILQTPAGIEDDGGLVFVDDNTIMRD